jgi:small subunit ribosomal protein S12e
MEALRAVLRNALAVEGLKRGLHECAKALSKTQKGPEGPLVADGGARLCVLAKDCDEATYVKLVKALCDQNGVPLIEVAAGQDLGQWCGLCKVDKEGKPRKIVSTSVAVVTDFGFVSEELNVLLQHLEANK